MKVIVTSAVIALSVSAGILIASSGSISVDESAKTYSTVENSASIAPNTETSTSIDESVKSHSTVENSASIAPNAETSTVDLSACKIQKTVSIRHALEEVAIDSHEPGGLDADDDLNRDGLDDEYNYIAAYVSEEQSEAIRTSIVDGSFMKGSSGTLKAIDIDPTQKITVCDDNHDLD